MATWYRRTYGRGRRRLVAVCRVTVPANYAAILVVLRCGHGVGRAQAATRPFLSGGLQPGCDGVLDFGRTIDRALRIVGIQLGEVAGVAHVDTVVG
ncbi:MAG: hypothetical protein NTY02_06870 [Acidobacteria bacterium]|nr:hypothetical protein [Acidobacteriota bacterium]